MKFSNVESYYSLLLLANQDIEEKIKRYVIDVRNRELSTSFMTIFLVQSKRFLK